jgi:hypothetical protein
MTDPPQKGALHDEGDHGSGATPITFKERRKRLEWQIRLVQRRMAEVERG